jgi:hypothetical protein
MYRNISCWNLSSTRNWDKLEICDSPCFVCTIFTTFCSMLYRRSLRTGLEYWVLNYKAVRTSWVWYRPIKCSFITEFYSCSTSRNTLRRTWSKSATKAFILDLHYKKLTQIRGYVTKFSLKKILCCKMSSRLLCRLFNDVVSNSDCMVSNVDGNQSWTGKDVGGSGRGVGCGYWAVFVWKDWRETHTPHSNQASPEWCLGIFGKY